MADAKTRKQGKETASFTKTRAFSVCVSLLSSILLSFLVIAVMLGIAGYDPGVVFGALFSGAFGDVSAWSESLLTSMPLIFSGLAVAFAFKCNLLNIGVEGQLTIGALCAGAAGIYITGLPSYLHIPLCILAAMAGGGLWALLPGYLKAARGCHEVIVTIMMNYIAFRVSAYFLNGPMQAQGANIAASENLQQSAWLPQLVPGTRLSIGILLAVVLAVLLWYILKYTRPGYKVKAVGLNADAARYAGVSIKKTIILTMLISGAIAGIAGGAEILGVHHRVYDQFSPGYGFDSIAVALLGYNNPLGVVISGFLFGSLKSGSVNMQTVAGTSKDLVRVIQAVIIFFSVTGFSFQKIVHWIRKKCKENPRQKRPVTKKGGEAP